MRDMEFIEWEMQQMAKRNRTRNERRARRSAFLLWLAVIAVLLAIIMLLAFICSARAEEPAEEVKAAPVVMPEIIVEEEEELPLTYLGRFGISHYCPCEKCCGEWADGMTATGTVATEGRTVAVDPDVIPYGSRIAVFYDDGRIVEYIAEDRGGAIKGNKLDVFVNDHGRANELGIMEACVYIVNEG